MVSNHHLYVFICEYPRFIIFKNAPIITKNSQKFENDEKDRIAEKQLTFAIPVELPWISLAESLKLLLLQVDQS